MGLNVSTNNGCGSKTQMGVEFSYENEYDCSADYKKYRIKRFYEDNPGKLSKDILDSVDKSKVYYVFTSSNQWAAIGGHNPKNIAETVNPAVYGNNGLFNDRSGIKFGWVYSDLVNLSTENYQS